MALACNPRLLIADEPTTALDVTVQAQILELIAQLKSEFKMAVMMITHNLAIVREVADKVAVMYAGKVVEHGATEDIFRRPSHPYTLGLFNALPQAIRHDAKLAIIGGNVPSPMEFPAGCRFHPRCPFADERCRRDAPELADVAARHQAACWFAGDVHEGRKTWPKN
jgi:peptide/nickel transport system ATP-binding protein/oligopeptide transport system ATP-binding protein